MQNRCSGGAFSDSGPWRDARTHAIATCRRVAMIAPSLLLLLACDAASDAATTASDATESGTAAGSTASGAPSAGGNPASVSDTGSQSGAAGSTAAGTSASAAPGGPAANDPAANDPAAPGDPAANDPAANDPVSGGAGLDAGSATSTGAPATGGDVTSDPAAGSDGSEATGAAGSVSAAAVWQQAFPTFTRHPIADFQSGYFTLAADVDGDGLQDVVGLSSGTAGLVWFKNPTWEKFNITTESERFICMAAHDVDGDGHIDLAIASEFDLNDSNTGGTVYWLEAPDDPTTDQQWALHYIDAVPTSHRLRWGDLDGDGKKELLNLPIFGVGSSAPAHAGAVQLKAYTIPADPASTWSGRVLNDTLLEVAHGINVVDWDGDGADDILTAANDGVDLFRPSLAGPPLHVGAGKDGAAPNRGSSEVSLGSLGGDRFIATIEPWHGTDTVIYTPGASATDLWQRQVIGTDFEHGHALVAVDLNGDGYDEVVGGGGQGARSQIIYRYVPSSASWEKIDLDIGGVAVSAIDISDINGDGAPDIVAIGGSPTNNVVWYENTP